MFNRLRIQNYRAFTDLRIDRLSRLNLFTGRNNSGKTTLLEALFLLCGAGTSQMALNVNVVRELNLVARLAVPETSWKSLFTAFDIERAVKIEGQHSSFGSLNLHIKIDRLGAVQVPLDSSSRKSMPEFPSFTGLLFSYKMGSKGTAKSRISLVGDELQAEPTDVQPPFAAAFLSSRNGDPQEDAVRLGRLRKRMQGDLVVKALQIVEPRLRSVEDNSASGGPMIWGDIGLPELVPLPVMGEGMTRVARAILAISLTPGGVVLMDEIESGLHHSILPKFWAAIGKAATQFNTQIFATTHSFECMEAAHRTLDDESFLVHRLEAVDGQIRCASYEPAELEAAVSHSLEVR